MVDLNRLIRVNTQIAVSDVPRLAFGRGLLVTIDEAIAAGGAGKVRLFDSAADAEDVLGAGDALDAVNVWFSADPAPQGIYVGRWANTDVATVLSGADDITVAAADAPLNSASASFAVNGMDVSVDLSGQTSYADIASTIETGIVALGGIFAGASFTYDTDHFLLTLAGADQISGGGFTTATVGTDDISTALRMTAAAGATYRQGSDTETVTAAVNAMLDATPGGAPAAVMLADDVPDTAGAVDTRTALAENAQASQDYIFSMLVTDLAALTPGDTTSHAAEAFAAQQGFVAVSYSEGEKIDVALMAALSAQNLSLAGSLITPHPKLLSGVTAVNLTGAQLTELTRKRVNVYTNIAGLPSLYGGTTSKTGTWLDARWWLNWLRSRIESEVFSTLRSSPRFTEALLVGVLGRVLREGVRNGGIMPGRTVEAATKADIIARTRNANFDGRLESGYLIFIPRRTQTDIDTRAIQFRIWITGSPAIHSIDGDIIFIN